jgi:hypothetical protein
MTVQPLAAAYQTLLTAAETVTATEQTPPTPGQWNAGEILAHLCLINAATIATACSVASGSISTYDNRIAHDPWTLRRVISFAGSSAGLQSRIRLQGDALVAIASGLSSAELATPIPTILVSNNELMVDEPLPLRVLIDGLATSELPGHTEQLLAL